MAKDLTQLTDAELYQSVVQPQIDARAQRAASTAVGLGMQYNADQYATALRLSPQLGAPPLRLMSDPRALQAMQAEMQAFETIKNNPPLQAWVNEDPDNALLAHDDFGYLDAVVEDAADPFTTISLCDDFLQDGEWKLTFKLTATSQGAARDALLQDLINSQLLEGWFALYEFT